MKEDKIQEAYQKMINERVVEVEPTLESIDDYLHFFTQVMKKGELKGNMEWGKEIKKTIDKIIKNF